MANKTIGELPSLSELSGDSTFVAEQEGKAYKISLNQINEEVKIKTGATLIDDDGILNVAIPIKGTISKEEYDRLPEEEKKGLYIVNDDSSQELIFVSSFNGRTGDVVPQSGDYTADMVGAVTMTQVNSAIQQAIFDSWEASY